MYNKKESNIIQIHRRNFLSEKRVDIYLQIDVIKIHRTHFLVMSHAHGRKECC